MSITHFLQKTEQLALTTYRKPSDLKNLYRTHVAFSGTPRKHPYDEARIVLVADPFSRNALYYEFNTEDIAFVEELPNLVTPDQEIIAIVRLWVKKGCLGLRCTPFRVDDTAG